MLSQHLDTAHLIGQNENGAGEHPGQGDGHHAHLVIPPDGDYAALGQDDAKHEKELL